MVTMRKAPTELLGNLIKSVWTRFQNWVAEVNKPHCIHCGSTDLYPHSRRNVHCNNCGKKT